MKCCSEIQIVDRALVISCRNPSFRQLLGNFWTRHSRRRAQRLLNPLKGRSKGL
jgi:hypothetical protein